jgi:L-aminopeptidase/D-esterase-like protein
MIRPGPHNLVTDVVGIAVGQAEDRRAWTGVTVLLPDRRAVAAVDVRGGGPGTRETDLLDPACLVQEVDAIVLSGGSVFGLDAASGVVAWLAARGRGLPVNGTVVPIVPAAVLFDLANGGDKGWGETPPYRALGLAACAEAGGALALGNAGAGYGAKAADLKGGVGSVSAVDAATGLTVGALVAANPRGSVVIPGHAAFWAWMLERDGEFGDRTPPDGPMSAILDALPAGSDPAPDAVAGANTTLAIVAVDADLTKAEARRLAIMAQDGIARAIRPSHTPFDGDTVFALATAARPLPEPRANSLARLGAMAADAVARAIARGVFEAETLGTKRGYRAVHGGSAGKPRTTP